MTGYFDEAQIQRLLAEYPIGEAFLEGPARFSHDQLHALRNRRFLKVVARAWQVPFYQRLWGAKGIEPGDIQSLDDITRLPVFSKADLMASIEAHPPFGDYHGMGEGERPSVVLHTTSGTTGAPQPLFFGAWDREVQNLLLARAYRLQGLRDHDVVHSVYGFGMVNGGHYVREAVLHFTKALFLAAGTGIETRSEQQVALMRRFGATVLVGFADYVMRLAEVARAQGIEPGVDIPLRMISGHLGQERRAEIAAAWGGAAVFDWYGVGDTGIVASEGPDQDGLYVFEDAHVLEVIDPETALPVADGQPGNICVTALFKDGIYPIVRFDTKDVTTRLSGRGSLGINLARIAGFQGRSDNMVKLRGVNVYPTAIGAHLREHDATLGEYVCRVERSGHRDQLTVMIEVRPEAVGDPAAQAALAVLLRQKLGVEVAVETVAPSATQPLTQIEARQKPIRLIDGR